ncbi:serine/threonine-protein phosphatase 2A 65 kDa regulatory subunit A beta (macronuclear) [Tetrahymena thermophila SB210]|uniref:Serine/threonine-protein phosphatase 2A 65 kDa regulatory subunit A beta n=1 Tax=Tetrahymena thermophila (strain SB210) TaxID=312017 RepID=I7MEN6_TETTS|nr:serine/threonine-protein phosphatase 2A 65 kDa regulatory subunit A beta [Tetrahymena thermophila SB210]EAR97263.1 serine/threonine-protein phosphatase 2A 65 kDa regulatory subunit A beta [Tetrahymena thermophila SB210]|eukprot:XP_001017508.1 serine/threonine-protein phosphatase 2A 65 kDa regulatory subunit A beta [Tetrahymena thermophila SB210]
MADIKEKSQVVNNKVKETESQQDQEADEFLSIKQYHPLNILLEEMKLANLKKRISCVRQIPSISIALGPEKTRALLIPFLSQLMVEEEEMQKEVLNLIPSLVNLVGGTYSSHILMDIIFDCLYKYDEGQVKETALNSLKDLFRKIDLRYFEKLLMDFINRILENDHFRAKEIAIVLMPEIFIALNEEYQLEIIEIFSKMSSDSTPMVRKTVAMKLKDFAKLIPPAPESQLLQIFDKLLQDENDYVRIPLVESLIPFSQVCIEKSEAEFIDILKKIINDKSVKVRGSIVDFVEDIKKSFSQNIFDEIIVPTYLSFLNTDAENDLKNRSLQNIVNLYNHIPQFSKLFLPKLKDLTKDKSLLVKQNLGEAIINLLTEGNKEQLIGIEEVFSDLLDDCDNETKFKLFKKIKDFGQLQKNLSVNIIRKILNSLETIAQNKKWRIRSSSLSTISRLIQEAKLTEDQFDQDFITMIKNSLNDSTAEIRLEAAKTVGSLANNFSPKFTQSKILPEFMDIWNNKSYLTRIGAPFCIKFSVQYLEEPYIQKEIKEYIKIGFQDKVPNIKIVCLEIIEIIFLKFSAETRNSYKQLLEKAAKDEDTEVRDRSKKLIKLLQDLKEK